MSSVVSYVDIIEVMTSIAERHYQVNSFFLGRDYELENNGDLVYPVFQVYPEFARMPINDYKQYKTLEVTLNCKVIDLTTNSDSNIKDVHSDTLRIAQDIVNELNAHPFYVRSNVSLMEDISFEALEHFDDDVTAGWKFSLKLKVINANTFCGMPIEQLPGYSANGPTSSGNYVTVDWRGPTGPQGPTGPAGIDGATGPQGATGSSGTFSQTLSQVLTAGNTLNSGQLIQGNDTSTYITLDGGFYVEYSTTNTGSIFISNTSHYNYHDLLIELDSSNIKLSQLSSNKLTYLDSNKYIKSLNLGSGLTFSGGTLSTTAVATPTLSQVLVAGATAGTSITMGSTKVIKSTNGGGELGLDGGSYGLANTVYLTNDNNGFGKSYLSFDSNVYGFTNYINLIANDTSIGTQTASVFVGVYSSDVSAYKSYLNATSDLIQLVYKTASLTLNGTGASSLIALNASSTVVSSVLRMTSNTANTLVYHDASKNLKSVTLGSGLTLTGGTLSVINKFSYTDASNGITSVSNSNTLSKSVLIPANTLTNGALNIKGRSQKSGSASFAWLVIYVNTTNSLSGASEIGRINNGGNNTILRFSIDRTIPIQVGSFTAFIINAITGYEETITNNVSTVTIDWTVDQYIILAVQANGGASPGESLVANFLSVNQF